MKFVQPNTQTTLLLDTAYMPFSVATARAAFYHMLKGVGSGIDSSGYHYSFRDGLPNVTMFKDQPIMRSAKDIWPIPTIFVINRKFTPKNMRLDKDGLPSIKYVWEFYKGICQCCLKPVSLREASRDHVHPKSKGGWNDLSNIVLMHKRCNNRHADQFPKFNANGDIIEPDFRMKPAHYVLPANITMRDEWKPYLFQ